MKGCPNADITINNITHNFNLNASESRDIQPRISHYLASQADQEDDLGKSNIIHNALIYYHQTNIKKDKSNKAICEKVSIKPIKTIPNNEEIRAKILENPYGYNFIVDLEVQYRNGKPALYTILKLIDRDEKDG